VMHPGTDPQPFLEPAYNYGKKMAKSIFDAAMKNALVRLKRRLP